MLAVTYRLRRDMKSYACLDDRSFAPLIEDEITYIQSLKLSRSIQIYRNINKLILCACGRDLIIYTLVISFLAWCGPTPR